ncbi:MAG: DUF1992 domain-containing protein [Planctomycetales bacterium]|nr:DUF1992 domain-containing protein [Planctomycetales bacterium]
MAELNFSDATVRLVAEHKIQAAIEAGDFDRLPGFGKPCALIDQPYDPHWWVRSKLRREELVERLTADMRPPLL